MQVAFIHRVVPIDVKQLLRHGGNTVHIVRIKGDNACAEYVRNVADGVIFVSLQRQFASQRIRSFDTRFDSRDNKSVAVQRILQRGLNNGFKALDIR